MVVDRVNGAATTGNVIHRTWTSAGLSRHSRDVSATSPGGNTSTSQAGKHSTSLEEPDCLGKVIRERRRDLGLTQEELAARVNRLGAEIRQSDISRLEHGKVTLPHHARLQRIAAALNLPFGEFLALAGWAGADEALDQQSA